MMKWISYLGVAVLICSCSRKMEQVMISPFRAEHILYHKIPIEYVLTTNYHDSKLDLIPELPHLIKVKKKSQFIYELTPLEYGHGRMFVVKKGLNGDKTIDTIRYKVYDYPWPTVSIPFADTVPIYYFQSRSAAMVRLFYHQLELPVEGYVHRVHKYQLSVYSRNDELIFENEYFGNQMNSQFGSVIDTLANIGRVRFHEFEIMDPFGKVIKDDAEFEFIIK